MFGFTKIADCAIHFNQVLCWGNASKKNFIAWKPSVWQTGFSHIFKNHFL